MSTILDVKNLKTHFVSKKHILPAVDGVDLAIKQGETVALVGESGCGKSITSLSIMGLVPEPNGKVVDGQITFNGTDLLSLSEKEMCEIRGKDIAMIFQDPMHSLNPVLTIGEQLTEVLIYHQNLRRKEAIKKTKEALELVGFANPENIIQEYPHRLSGGMRQRVMTAMAMLCNPKLLIADEPTTALDVTIQAEVLSLMKNLNQQFNTSILLITHDLGVVSEMANKVIVMYAGQVVEEAEVDELFDEPLHPYTKGLINAVPNIDGDNLELASIPGNVPTPDNLPNHCRFADRCPMAFDRCYAEQPESIEVSNSRNVRCFLYENI